MYPIWKEECLMRTVKKFFISAKFCVKSIIWKNIVHNDESKSLLAPISCVNVTAWKKYNLKD